MQSNRHRYITYSTRLGAAQLGVVRIAQSALYLQSLICASHIDDCTQEWTFSPDSLDYVHMRYLTGSIVDWGALFHEAFRCCKPGGYIESLESAPWLESDDGTVTDKTAMCQWGELFVQGGLKIGRSFTLVDDEEQRKGMKAAGFVDIQEFNIKVSFLPFSHYKVLLTSWHRFLLETGPKTRS